MSEGSGPKHVIVSEYDPAWPGQFEALRANIQPVVRGLALAIEHVGSTSVPALAAKPVIDIDIVAEASQVRPIIAQLAGLGYAHRGDLGVPTREAFRSPSGAPKHRLYVCLAGGLALRNHLLLRDYLRRNPAARDSYAALKRNLAARFPYDIDAYIAGKTTLISQLLIDAGMAPADVRSIAALNTLESLKRES